MNVRSLELDAELAESINVVSGLSEWEAEFVNSILIQLHSERKMLSHKQRQIAERIQRRIDGEIPR